MPAGKDLEVGAAEDALALGVGDVETASIEHVEDVSGLLGSQRGSGRAPRGARSTARKFSFDLGRRDETVWNHCSPSDARDLFDAYVAAADERGLLEPMLGVWRDGLSYAYGSRYLPYLLEMQAAQPTSDWMIGELDLVPDYTGFVQNLNVNCADNAEQLLTFEDADARLGDALERRPSVLAPSWRPSSCAMAGRWPPIRNLRRR